MASKKKLLKRFRKDFTKNFSVNLQLLQFLQFNLTAPFSWAVFPKLLNKNKMNASVKIVLDSKPMSNGQYSVYLRITKARKTKKN